MKYRVTIEGTEREIDVMVAPDGSVLVSENGARVDCDARVTPAGVSLRLGERVFDVVVGGPANAMQLAAGERRAVAEVSSPRMRSKQKKRGGLGASSDAIVAPMPGRVVKVLVTEGQEVAEGDPCVVVEAMKMENELRAPKSGTVSKVHVSEGAAVEGQTLLVSF